MSTATSSNDDIYMKDAEASPVVQVLDTVGTRWRLRILYALRDSELRFNELKRATGGRSKTVSDTLGVLSDSGLITRRTEEAAPVAVYYGLTDKGEALVSHLDDVSQWAVEWMDDVEKPEEFPNRS